MEKNKTLKFINNKLKHKSTRKDDKLRLEDCRETLEDGKELDSTQQSFIRSLKEEALQRGRKYTKNYTEKSLAIENNIKDIDTEELLEDIEDLVSKLQLIKEDVQNGRSIDSTKFSLLKYHNVV